MYTYDVEPFWEKIEWDQCDSQYPKGEKDVDRGAFPHTSAAGLLPSIAPRYARFLVDGGDGSFWDIIPWGSSLAVGSERRGSASPERKRMPGTFMNLSGNIPITSMRNISAMPLFMERKKASAFLRQGLGELGNLERRGQFQGKY